MARLTVESVKTTVEAKGLKLVVHAKKKNLYKYVITDENYNPLYGGHTLKELIEDMNANAPASASASASASAPASAPALKKAKKPSMGNSYESVLDYLWNNGFTYSTLEKRGKRGKVTTYWMFTVNGKVIFAHNLKELKAVAAA